MYRGRERIPHVALALVLGVFGAVAAQADIITGLVGYNNVKTPFYSEAERAWSTQQGWTADALDTLVLYVQGRSGNAAGTLYVTVEDGAGRKGTVTCPDAAILAATKWTEWRIPLSSFSSAGVNLARVKKLCLGVGNRATPVKGGAGRICVDDIQLLRPIPAKP